MVYIHEMSAKGQRIPLPRRTPLSVAICAAFLNDTAAFVSDWADVCRKECPGASLLIAHRDQDYKVLEACNLTTARSVPYLCRGGVALQQRALGRLALMRYALESKIDVVWFVDPHVAPPKGAWGLICSALQNGADAVIVPFAPEWTNGTPAVCVEIEGQLRMIDPTKERGNLIDAVGGELGCTAIATMVAASVPLTLGRLEFEKGAVESESVGWFANARALGKTIKSLTAAASVRAAAAAPASAM